MHPNSYEPACPLDVFKIVLSSYKQKSTHNFSSAVPPNLSLHVDLSKYYFLVCSYEVGAENSNNFNTLFEIYSEI